MEEAEEKVKGEVEDMVVEKVEGMGMGQSGVSHWLREFLGQRAAGSSWTCPGSQGGFSLRSGRAFIDILLASL